MNKIAHLKVTCPQCGEETSIYVVEDGGSGAEVKCEHCKQVFVFSEGMEYEPVAYVESIPYWAVIPKADEGKIFSQEIDTNTSELKQRHGCLTTWLILLVIVNVGVAIVLMLLDNIDTTSKATYAMNAIIIVISVILLWNWKRIGFWIFVGVAVLGLIGSLLTGDYKTAFQCIIPVAILWSVLQRKKDNHPSGWENMK